jgi:NADPH:quinone reductase-like Zn-dependent oxidoreductase
MRGLPLGVDPGFPGRLSERRIPRAASGFSSGRRTPETLSAVGATHVCDSSQSGFHEALAAAIAETQATLAFDAIGGGTLASDILEAMEAGAARLHAAVRVVNDLWEMTSDRTRLLEWSHA